MAESACGTILGFSEKRALKVRPKCCKTRFGRKAFQAEYSKCKGPEVGISLAS